MDYLKKMNFLRNNRLIRNERDISDKGKFIKSNFNVESLSIDEFFKFIKLFCLGNGNIEFLKEAFENNNISNKLSSFTQNMYFNVKELSL